MRLSAAELSSKLGLDLHGDPETAIEGVASLEEATALDLSFCVSRRHESALVGSRAGTVILNPATYDAYKGNLLEKVVLASETPDLDYAKALELFYPQPAVTPGIHPSAVVEEGAIVDSTASVMALSYVGPGARIGARTVIRPQAHLGAGAVVGSNCELHPHSVVEADCRLGDRVILHAGAVVGADGFGYVFSAKGAAPYHHKVPQVGIVVIEDDVEVGAGSCIDRATTGETRIGRGSKIDNQVQIGHNCRVGALSIICGQSGLAGSTELGAGVVIAGGVGLAGHLKVGDGVKIGAGSGVMTDVPAGETFAGSPAQEHRTWLRVQAALRRLPELLRRMKTLEQRVESAFNDLEKN